MPLPVTFELMALLTSEMHFEKFLLFGSWNTYSRIFNLYIPVVFCSGSEDMYITSFGCIFQGIGYKILQDRIHFIFIKPYIHIAEITFISQADTFHFGIGAEDIYQFLHIRV